MEIVYNSWWLNQPNNARDGENCIDFRPRWTHDKALWLDSSCEDEIQSICEGVSTLSTTTSPLSTSALPTPNSSSTFMSTATSSSTPTSTTISTTITISTTTTMSTTSTSAPTTTISTSTTTT